MIQNWSLKWCVWGRVDRECLKLKGYFGGGNGSKKEEQISWKWGREVFVGFGEEIDLGYQVF